MGGSHSIPALFPTYSHPIPKICDKKFVFGRSIAWVGHEIRCRSDVLRTFLRRFESWMIKIYLVESWTTLRRSQNVSETFCVRNKLDILPLASIASVYTLAKKIKKEVGTEFVFCVNFFLIWINFRAYPDPKLDNGC